MEPVTGSVIAGIIVSLLNKYVLDFKWCTVVKNWYEGDDSDWCDHDDDDDESDMTPSSSTAVSTDAIMTHHVVTHVH